MADDAGALGEVLGRLARIAVGGADATPGGGADASGTAVETVGDDGELAEVGREVGAILLVYATLGDAAVGEEGLVHDGAGAEVVPE
jgi:hypothetical protein